MYLVIVTSADEDAEDAVIAAVFRRAGATPYLDTDGGVRLLVYRAFDRAGAVALCRDVADAAGAARCRVVEVDGGQEVRRRGVAEFLTGG